MVRNCDSSEVTGVSPSLRYLPSVSFSKKFTVPRRIASFAVSRETNAIRVHEIFADAINYAVRRGQRGCGGRKSDGYTEMASEKGQPPTKGQRST